MNILFTSDLSGMGGGETSLVNLVLFLKSKHNVCVLCNCEGTLVQLLRKYGVKTYVVNYRNKSVFAKSFISIRKIIKDEKISITHSNDPLTSVFMRFVSIGLNVKNYWTCHGQWYRFSFLKLKLIQYSNNHVFCVSQKVKDSLDKMHFTKTSVTYLGINSRLYSNAKKSTIRTEYNIPNDQFTLACIGRFQPIKGQLKLVKAIHKLIIDGFSFKCLLIGGCVYNNIEEIEYKNRITEYIKTYKLDKYIILTGERADIPNIMKSLNLLVIPSDNESFGMVAIEALSSNLPIISTPNDGVSEILDNSEHFITKTNDSEGLYVKIKEFILFPALRKEALEFCLKKKGQYSIDCIAQKYLYEFSLNH